jgi:hypothetical protein
MTTTISYLRRPCLGQSKEQEPNAEKRNKAQLEQTEKTFYQNGILCKIYEAKTFLVPFLFNGCTL